MYLGVVSIIVIELNDKTEEEYKIISLCDKTNSIKKIALKNADNLKIGDLFFIKIDEDGTHNFEKVLDSTFDNDSKLGEDFLFQLFNLIDKENEELKKEKDEQEREKLELKNPKSLINLYNRASYFRNREAAIKLMINKFIHFARTIKINLNDLTKYFEIQCMKIILETQTLSFNFEKWENSVVLVLYLSYSNDINEELLIRAIESLLNIRLIDNETNELKLQLEQQLKEKLNELKGKQKELV